MLILISLSIISRSFQLAEAPFHSADDALATKIATTTLWLPPSSEILLMKLQDLFTTGMAPCLSFSRALPRSPSFGLSSRSIHAYC